MTKVEVFSTLKEADSKLRLHFSKNKDILIRIFTELQVRSEVYRKSAEFRRLHPEGKDAVLAPEELLHLSKDLGRGEVVTSFIKLYAFDLHTFGFDYTVFSADDAITFIPYNSIPTLTESVREQIQQDRSGNINLKAVPLFYTVLEPFTYSENDKKKARMALQYNDLSLENKLILDKFLDTYFERGLSQAEIKDFVYGYVKFLN